MLTFILSAVCAMGINASVEAVQADTLDWYIINDKRVEKFDGSQLVGKNVSDYKVVVADGEVAGRVLRMHLIRTDGKKSKAVKSAWAADVASGSETAAGKQDVAVVKVSVSSSNDVIHIIDGKKGSREDLNKIKPADIASMTVYKAGSKEAVELSGKQDVAVVKVETKKQ